MIRRILAIIFVCVLSGFLFTRSSSLVPAPSLTIASADEATETTPAQNEMLPPPIQQVSTTVPSQEKIQQAPKIDENAPRHFEAPRLQAKAAYVFDVKGGKELYSLNENTVLPLASLTKVVSVMVATDLTKPQASADQLSLKNIIIKTLVASSNEAAHALASASLGIPLDAPVAPFISKMNKLVWDLGFTRTYFLNETGLDLGDNKNGGYSTAKEFAQIFLHAVEHYYEEMEPTRHLSFNLDGEEVENTNTIIGRIPGLIASKTGETPLAGGNLAIVFEVRENHPIVIVVLGSTDEGRFSDVLKLVNAAELYFK